MGETYVGWGQTPYHFTVKPPELSKISNSFLPNPFRYAVQLLSPAAVTAKICGRTNVVKDDIKDVGELFLDAKSSAQMLERNADKYMK